MNTANAALRIIGWPATVLFGDPLMYDRWRWLRHHLRGGTLRTLDAGCGSGAFTMYAARLGNEALGISFHERENRIARERAALLGIRRTTFIDRDLRELDRYAEELGRFDQLICMETIEHVRDDERLIRNLSALLRPGGRLLLTTPQAAHRPMWGEDPPSSVEDGGHLRWGYDPAELKRMFEACGLEVESVELVSGVVSQSLVSLARMASRLHDRLGWIVTLPLRIVQPLDRPLSVLLHFPPHSVALVGVRNGQAPE
jgi:SAM-dependent methyltransferase